MELDFSHMSSEFVKESIAAIERQAKKAGLAPEQVQVIFSVGIEEKMIQGDKQPIAVAVFKVMKNNDFKNAEEISCKKLLNIFVDITRKAQLVSSFIIMALAGYMEEYGIEPDKIFVFVRYGKDPQGRTAIALALTKLNEQNQFELIKHISPSEIFSEQMLEKAMNITESAGVNLSEEDIEKMDQE